MRLSKGLIKADIIAARQAIEYYEEKRIKDIKNVAAYHLQQAAEKLIKYQIYKSGLKIDNSRIYTHNIEKLILYGESIGIPFYIPEYVREKSLRLTDWEAGSRYDIGFSIRIDLLKKVFGIIEEWYFSVK